MHSCIQYYRTVILQQNICDCEPTITLMKLDHFHLFVNIEIQLNHLDNLMFLSQSIIVPLNIVFLTLDRCCCFAKTEVN